VSKDADGAYQICQSKYIEQIAKEFQLSDAKRAKYPLDPGYHQLKDERFLDSNALYRRLIGKLLYVSTHTRPDISASVGILAKRVSNPRQLDYNEALRVVKYLLYTKEKRLKLYSRTHTRALVGHADADWAEDRETRKSISGFTCVVLGGTVSWCSRRQVTVALSTTEAELYALTEAALELEWLNRILRDFGVESEKSLLLFTDNQSTRAAIINKKVSAKLKHIDTKLHFIRDWVENKRLLIEYCPTDDNVADMLTKPLAGTKIAKLSQLAGLM
jgi:hypothetical protein